MRDIRVYRQEDKPFSIEIGKIKCPVCSSSGSHIERKGKGFITWFCQCSYCNKNSQLSKELEDLFQLGDLIRYYDTATFGENAQIDFTTYVEGPIIKKEKGIINYHIDIKIQRAVFKNKEYPKNASICNDNVRGIESTSNLIELLTPQMKLII